VGVRRRHPDVLERSEDSVRAWLFTVARNLTVDHLRSARRTRATPSISSSFCASASIVKGWR
jgi:DNA-directed RNA polymerase specialized sigma24 family protein